MPDQYTLSTFERTEHARPGRGPVMSEIELISSHAPWTPVPDLVDWNDVGDGSGVFDAAAAAGDSADSVWLDPAKVRTQYRKSIEYSVRTLVSYLERYGTDKTVLVFLGDHQPSPIVTGEDATRDVPVTIVARDPAVLEQVSGWGWDEGLKPGPQAPVWKMSDFRDRFLTAFGSRPSA
jgi:hypothetical protein